MADVPGILIVDDNEDNRYTLQLLLESDGHERIASASSGNEAIALLEKQKFSLVLLDLMMPDLNGDEVLKLIKSDPDKRDIPVVMLKPTPTPRRSPNASSSAPTTICPSRSIRRSCARASPRRCADTRYGRWKTSIWARSRTKSGILRISCATFCRLKS
jgi:DNA-binding NarL/FixJ family response regulator